VETGGQLATTHSFRTMNSLYGNIASVFYFMNERFVGRSFDSLKYEELVELVIHNIDGSIGRFGTVYGRVRLLAWMYDLRLTNDCLVPGKYLPAYNLTGSWEDLCSRRVRESGESPVEWRAGGSFDIIPFEISLAILAYCIQLIKSDETKYILAWFQAERKLRAKGRLPEWRAVKKVFSMFGNRSGQYGPREQARYVDKVYFEKLCSYYPYAKSREQLPLSSVPFVVGTHSIKESLTRKGDHLLTACFISILILTGTRHGEAASMSSNSFKENGSSYTFASNIDKTNHGVATDRHVSGIVSEFIAVLDGLGSFALADPERKHLFSYFRHSYSTGNSAEYFLGKNHVNAMMQINSFYEVFLEEQGDDFQSYCSRVTAHGFRHTWAEFAMRRFDGNVMPLIRDHYRHHFGSKMTAAYTHNKIELSEYQHLGRRQLFELVSRYVEGAASLHGQLGTFLTRLADNVGLIEMHDKGARDDAIMQMIEEHMGDPIVTPHEYGLCILTSNTRHLANCRDEAGIPKTQTAEVDSCAGCVNHCVVKQTDGKDNTHFRTLQRLLATYRAEAKEWQGNDLIGPLFKNEAEKTHRTLEALVRKMEKGDV
jgi:integrase